MVSPDHSATSAEICGYYLGVSEIWGLVALNQPGQFLGGFEHRGGRRNAMSTHWPRENLLSGASLRQGPSRELGCASGSKTIRTAVTSGEPFASDSGIYFRALV
jgi:hypothetical protein